MSSPSCNNGDNDSWLMKIELKREEPGEINKEDEIKKAMVWMELSSVRDVKN